jgi:hypothetical protein
MPAALSALHLSSGGHAIRAIQKRKQAAGKPIVQETQSRSFEFLRRKQGLN